LPEAEVGIAFRAPRECRRALEFEPWCGLRTGPDPSDRYDFRFANGLATSRVVSMKSRATGLSVRFFSVTRGISTCVNPRIRRRNSKTDHPSNLGRRSDRNPVLCHIACQS